MAQHKKGRVRRLESNEIAFSAGTAPAKHALIYAGDAQCVFLVSIALGSPRAAVWIVDPKTVGGPSPDVIEFGKLKAGAQVFVTTPAGLYREVKISAPDPGQEPALGTVKFIR